MSHANFFAQAHQTRSRILCVLLSLLCHSPKAAKSSNLKNDSTIKSKVAITSTHHSLSRHQQSLNIFSLPALCFAVIFSLRFKGYFIRVIYDFLPPHFHSLVHPPTRLESSLFFWFLPLCIVLQRAYTKAEWKLEKTRMAKHKTKFLNVLPVLFAILYHLSLSTEHE